MQRSLPVEVEVVVTPLVVLLVMLEPLPLEDDELNELPPLDDELDEPAASTIHTLEQPTWLGSMTPFACRTCQGHPQPTMPSL